MTERGYVDQKKRERQLHAARLHCIALEVTAKRRTLSRDEADRLHVLTVFRASNGNKYRASRKLGVDRKTLYRLLDQWVLEAPLDAAAALARAANG